MDPYKITYLHFDMEEGQISTATKWAHDKKSAVRLLLSKNPDKNGYCVFKRGGRGRILDVEQIDPLIFEPVRSSPRDE